jgi:hypothetical protein
MATMLRWFSRHRAKEYVRLSQCSTHCAPYKHFTDDEAIEHRRQVHSLALTHRLSHSRSQFVGQKVHWRDLVSRTFRFEPPKSGQASRLSCAHMTGTRSARNK